MKHLGCLKTAPRHDLIRDYVLDAVNQYSENNAFVLKEESEGKTYYRSITYRAFWEQMRRFGSGLCKLGLQGKRIALIGLNSYEWILTYLSVLCGVGIIVPLDKELTEPEILLSLRRAKADAVVFDTKHQKLMEELSQNNDMGISHFISTQKISESLPSIGEISEAGILYGKEHKDFDEYAPDPDEMTSIIFTSGDRKSVV